MSYRWRLNNVDVCGLGLESMTLSLRAGGPDTLAWAYQRDPSGTPPFAIHAVVTLVCETVDAKGLVVDAETMFKGRVTSAPKRDAGSSGGWTITAANGWGDMRRIVLTQDWKSWNPATRALVTRAVPRVVLGLGHAGTYIHTGDIIREIVDHSSAKGAIISKGTISPALYVPPTELVDTVADAALRQILAYHPDHIAWIEEGDRLHVRPPSALETIWIDPCSAGMEVEHDDQADEMPGGVTIVWERLHDVDGEQKVERIHQSAGATSGWPPPLYMTMPLAGATLGSKIEVIETRTLPVPGATSADVAKRFLKGLLPQLAEADNADLLIASYKVSFADPVLDDMDDDEVAPNSKPIDRGGDEPEDFPRMLVSGQVQPWFPGDVKQYDAVLKAKITYSGSVPEVLAYVGTGLEIDEPITITNALPKTYRVTDQIDAGEAPVDGLASSYWTAISGARDEGTIRGPMQATYRDLRPGRKVLVTGYFSTASPIVESTMDILAETVSAKFGRGEFLNPKTIADLAKAMARNTPSWRRPEERTQGEADSGSGGPIREGGKASKQTATPRRITGRQAPRLWDLEIVSAAAKTVRLTLPGIVRKTGALDGSGVVSVGSIGATFTAAAGKLLALKYTPSLAVTLEMLDEWDGWPMPFDTSAVLGLAKMTHGYHPLWEFLSASDDPDAIRILAPDADPETAIYAEFRGFNSHLMFVQTHMEDADGLVVPIYELLPAQGARRPA